MKCHLSNLVKYEKTKVCGILIIVVFWIMYHISTIPISPLPNYDEVFFASISNEYQNTGLLNLKAGTLPGENSIEVLEYGPIYFLLQGLVISKFGLSITSARSISLICGILLFLGVTLLTWFRTKRYMCSRFII